MPPRGAADRLGLTAKRLAGGFSWEVAAAGTAILLQLGYAAYTGRHVTAAHFGAYATALAIVHFSATFAEGFGQLVLTYSGGRPGQLRRSLLLAGCVGATTCLLFEAVAPLWGLIWPEVPGLVEFVRLLVLANLVAPAAAVCTAGLRASLRFRTAALLELLGQATAMALALALLRQGWNPFAIAMPATVGTAVPLLGGLLLLAPRLRGRGGAEPYRALVRQLWICTRYTMLQSVIFSVPMWLAAAVLGAAGAGHYSRAFYFASIMSGVLTNGLSRIAIPALARVRDAAEPLGPAIARAHGATCLLLAPAVTLMAGLGPMGLVLLLGPGWGQAAELLPWFLPGLALQVLCVLGWQIDLVRGDKGGVLRTQAVALGVMLAAAAAVPALGDARALALATLPATAAVHGLQVSRWRRRGLLRLRGWLPAVGRGAAVVPGQHRAPPSAAPPGAPASRRTAG
ncbi:oligosaccharide flippase family protein [Streptomyces boninensis]|uniref:oligosaccharide flippase family protein n=1 Tax=Streptomyces boninensis TaxID=2039455 RepID=UPI003B2148BB